MMCSRFLTRIPPSLTPTVDTCCQNQSFLKDWCKGNDCAKCCECLCCPTISLSTTRIAAMHYYQLSSDPQDRQLIRLSNCLQLLSCICHILALFSRVSTGCGGVSVCD